MSWTRGLAWAASGTAAAAVGAAGWRFADELLTPVPSPVQDPADRAEVSTSGDSAVELTGPTAGRPGTWGLVWEDGYAQVGPAEATAGAAVRRRLLAGDVPPSGQQVRFDAAAYPPDPAAVGSTWRRLRFRSPAGELPATLFEPAVGPSTTWALLVHGRGGRPSEMHRWVPLLSRLGLPSLVVATRNADGAPASTDGLSHLGDSEWEDIEGALVHARSQGAQDVVLVGASMGGAAVLSLLRRSAHAGSVRAVVLDAPVLHWPPVLWLAAQRRGVPGPLLPALIPAGMAAARIRAGIDWGALDHAGHAGRFRHPMLLLHGEDDDRVPVGLSDAFARRRPDLVTYVRVAGAGHLRAWNVDRARVEGAVEAFLAEHLRRRRTTLSRARSTLTRLHRRGQVTPGGSAPPPRRRR